MEMLYYNTKQGPNYLFLVQDKTVEVFSTEYCSMPLTENDKWYLLVFSPPL